MPLLTDAGFDCMDWWISLVCLNPWLGTSGANGEQRQRSTCPIAAHPPAKAIIGNIERHSFNFIPSTVQAALYNVIISSRSVGPLTGPCYPDTREMQIDFISAMAFLRPLHVT